MSSFVVKIIACVTMILDHIKYAIPQTENILTIYLGRTSYPIFAFLLVEGYIHTRDLKKYYKRLFIFAIISQIPFMFFRTLVGEWKMLNIMFTLLLGLLAITAYDKIKKEYISFPICLLLILLGDIINVDYGWFGVLTILILYIFRKSKTLKSLGYILLVVFYFYMMNVNFTNINTIKIFVAYLIPVIPIVMYNGNQGKKIKYFFYWFYPIHMAIIYCISFLFI